MNTKKLFILGAAVALLFAGALLSPQKAEAYGVCSEMTDWYPGGSIALSVWNNSGDIVFGPPSCASNHTQSGSDRTCEITVTSGTILDAQYLSHNESSSFTMESWPFDRQQYAGPCGNLPGCSGEGRTHRSDAITTSASFGLTTITYCQETDEWGNTHVGPLGNEGRVTINVTIDDVVNPPDPPDPPDPNPPACDFTCNLIVTPASGAPDSNFEFNVRTGDSEFCSRNRTGDGRTNRRFSLDDTSDGSYVGTEANGGPGWTGHWRSLQQNGSWTRAPYSVADTYTATGKLEWRNSPNPDGIVERTCTAPVTVQTHYACSGSSCIVDNTTPGPYTASDCGGACALSENPTCGLSPGSQTVVGQPVSFTAGNINFSQSYSWQALNADAIPLTDNSINPFVTTYSASGTKTVKIIQGIASSTCAAVITPGGNTHLSCVGTSCTAVPGSGTDDCSACTSGGPYTLEVRKDGTGTGIVSGNPPGNPPPLPLGDDILCGTNCDASFNAGTSVTLHQNAAAGSHFVRWVGVGVENEDCNLNSPSNVSILMDTNKICTARFNLDTPPCAATSTITVTSNISATWAITGPEAFNQNTPTTSASYASHHTGTYQLVAFPVAGYTGVVTPPASQTIGICGGGPLNFGVTYTPSGGPFTLSVTKNGSGTGTVTGDPSGNGGDDILCGANCAAPFNSGVPVTLTAEPSANSHFVSWSGACSGTNSVFTVTMNADKTCNATFDKGSGLLYACTGAGGTCEVNPYGQYTTSDCDNDCPVLPSPASCTFTAAPKLISIGGSSVLTWKCTGVRTCTVTNLTTGAPPIVPNGPPAGKVTVHPTSTTAYELNCSNASFVTSTTVRVRTLRECNPGDPTCNPPPVGQ